MAKKPCGCDEANPELAANVRNAAALFVSAGKVAGFVEGVRWACEGFAKMVADGLEPELKKKRMKGEDRETRAVRVLTHLRNYIDSIARQASDRQQEQISLSKAAEAMVDRLEKGALRLPSVASRVRSALRALRG